jgi:poly(ADP-ribose) glycohydrolase
VIHYFYRVTDDNCTSSGLLRFHRRCLRALPRFESSSDELFGAGLTVSAKGKIEDCPTKKFIHADFANKILGGGVLGHGLVQEGANVL